MNKQPISLRELRRTTIHDLRAKVASVEADNARLRSIIQRVIECAKPNKTMFVMQEMVRILEEAKLQ